MVWKQRLQTAFLIILASLSFSLVTVTAQQTGKIVVRVVGLKSKQGNVRLALYDNAESFPSLLNEGDPKIRETCLIQTDERDMLVCEVTITKLPYGVYAILVGHDENQDGKIEKYSDREPKGASNYTEKLKWWPDFDKAKFEHNNEEIVLVIHVY